MYVGEHKGKLKDSDEKNDLKNKHLTLLKNNGDSLTFDVEVQVGVQFSEFVLNVALVHASIGRLWLLQVAHQHIIYIVWSVSEGKLGVRVIIPINFVVWMSRAIAV